MPLLDVIELQKHYTMSKASIDWQAVFRQFASILPLRRASTEFDKPTSSQGDLKKPARVLYAVDGVSFQVHKNESVGLVGESGCGKSTLVKALSRLSDVDGGEIHLLDENISATPAKRFVHSKLRKHIQVVFQDSHDSLNPRYSAFQCIADPLINLLAIKDSAELTQRIYDLADKVNFPRELLTRLPHQLSGGQKARVNIARAIAVAPSLLILDEPTSALDVSVQAIILKLLDSLKKELQLSYLFVSHDLNVVRMLCDRILVMYMGKIVELGDSHSLYRHSAHPYTQALISAIPAINASHSRILLSGEVGSPINPEPNVCRFYLRCPKRSELCRQKQPLLRKLSEQHYVACHHV